MGNRISHKIRLTEGRRDPKQRHKRTRRKMRKDTPRGPVNKHSRTQGRGRWWKQPRVGWNNMEMDKNKQQDEMQREAMGRDGQEARSARHRIDYSSTQGTCHEAPQYCATHKGTEALQLPKWRGCPGKARDLNRQKLEGRNYSSKITKEWKKTTLFHLSVS